MIQTHLHPLDIVIIVLYLAMLASVGVYFSRRQKSLDEYFLAKQSMAWLPVGLSLMAALDSAIDYLMQPSATIKYGLFLLIGTSSWFFLYPWVSKVTLPFYRRLNYFTAYEYLEARFDVRVRALAAVIFIVWRLGWMATAIYVPSLAISTATGDRIPVTTLVLGLGVIVTLYTALGGIEAVIWNDVAQFCVRFGGLAAVVAIAAASVRGGFSNIWAVASAAGKTSVIAPVDTSSLTAFFVQPMNVVAIMFSMVVGRMASYTSDQIMVQRLQTTKSLKDARQAFIVNAAGDALWMFALSFVGLALFAFFQTRPLPNDFATDKILPYFMSLTFPAGIVGLVIASIMAASLSSVDSAINSCTSVLVIDIYNRLIRGRETLRESPGRPGGARDAQDVFVSRIATAGFGVLGTILAMNVSKIGSLLEIANKLINAFSGPLFGMYILAMFSRRATSSAALAAGILGSLTSYVVAYHSRIGFMWPSTLGFAATLVVGFAWSLVVPGRPSQRALQLTWWNVMASAPESRQV